MKVAYFGDLSSKQGPLFVVPPDHTTNLSPFTFPVPDGGKQPFLSPRGAVRGLGPGWRAEPVQPIGCNDSARRIWASITVRQKINFPREIMNRVNSQFPTV